MKTTNILFLIILGQFLTFSCGKKSDCEKLPYIIIVDNPDTVRAGDEYLATIYLSDTSFFKIQETNSLISPMMLVNDMEIEVNKNNLGNV